VGRRSNSSFLLSSSSVTSQNIEKHLESDHLVINCSISNNYENKYRTHAFIDCGATGYAFIDEEFARHHKFPLITLTNPRTVEVIDGRSIAPGLITHITKLRLEINQHSEEITMFATKLGHYPMVLGIPWLKKHDPGQLTSSILDHSQRSPLILVQLSMQL
jgi:predicted aspartyl protease